MDSNGFKLKTQFYYNKKNRIINFLSKLKLIDREKHDRFKDSPACTPSQISCLLYFCRLILTLVRSVTLSPIRSFLLQLFDLPHLVIPLAFFLQSCLVFAKQSLLHLSPCCPPDFLDEQWNVRKKTHHLVCHRGFRHKSSFSWHELFPKEKLAGGHCTVPMKRKNGH